MQKAEPLVSKPSSFKVEYVENLKRCNSPGTDQILAEVIQAGGYKLHSEIHKHMNSIWNNEEFIYYKKSDKTDLVITKVRHCYQLLPKFYPITFSQT